MWFVAGILIVLLTLVRTLPWIYREIPVSSDNSWDVALNLFVQRGSLAGQDYVFTFGPLGFLYNKTFFPATFNLKILLQAVFCIATTTVMILQGKKLFANPFLTVLWIYCLVSLYGFFGDVFFLAAPVLLANQYFFLDDRDGKKRASFETMLLVCLLALSAEVKFTFFVAGVWLMAFITLDQVLIKRARPTLLLVFTAVFVLAWLLAGQPLVNLPTYLATSLVVASGHSEAMSYSETNWQWPICATIISTGLLLLCFAQLAFKRLGKAFPIAVLAESGVFF